MKLLSELPQYRQFVFGFLKFSKKEYLEELQQGNLYMNNLKYFIDLEKQTGIKGMGDSFEGSHVLKEITLEFRDPKTDETLLKGKAKQAVMRLDEFMGIHLFCMTAIDSSMLEIVEEDDDYFYTILHLTDQQKENFISEFGDHSLIILRDGFVDNFTKSFEEQGIQYRSSLVKYADFNVNQEERMQSFYKQDPSFFFWKSDEISYQKEYRIVILNKPSSNAIIIKIGDMTEYSLIIPVSQMLDKEKGLSIRVRKI